MRTDVFGWFDKTDAFTPAHDPTVEDGKCPICGSGLIRPVMTISLMKDGDDRSYFFRCHKGCYENISDEELNLIESSLIDELSTT